MSDVIEVSPQALKVGMLLEEHDFAPIRVVRSPRDAWDGWTVSTDRGQRTFFDRAATVRVAVGDPPPRTLTVGAVTMLLSIAAERRAVGETLLRSDRQFAREHGDLMRRDADALEALVGRLSDG